MRIRLGLDAKSIDSAIKQLATYRKSVDAKVDELCERLADEGMEVAKVSIRHDESGELRNSFSVEKVGDAHYLVVNSAPYAVYVEFGTGVVGAGGDYRGERPEWAGSPNGEKEAWVYFDEKQGRFRITDGQAPQAFMAQGAEAMRNRMIGIAKEVFAA